MTTPSTLCPCQFGFKAPFLGTSNPYGSLGVMITCLHNCLFYQTVRSKRGGLIFIHHGL